MNSTANLITRIPGSSSLNSSVRSASLGASEEPSSGFHFGAPGTYIPLHDQEDEDETVIRGGIPMSMRSSSGASSLSISKPDAPPSYSSISSGGVPSGNVLESQSLLGSTGMGLANIVGAITGTTTKGAIQTRQAQDQAVINSTTSTNLGAHGVGLLPSINAIQSNQHNRVAGATAGATFGSLLGPLGALAGYGIGGALSSSLDADLPRNVSTFAGNTSGNFAGLAGSHSTSDGDLNPILSANG